MWAPAIKTIRIRILIFMPERKPRERRVSPCMPRIHLCDDERIYQNQITFLSACTQRQGPSTV